MDQFVKELTDTLSKWDVDVVLVMYGDHLPTMGLNVTDVENKYLFQTEYVIWYNMGLEKKDKNQASGQHICYSAASILESGICSKADSGADKNCREKSGYSADRTGICRGEYPGQSLI